jgi:Predicted integral membrane protein
MEKRKKVYLLLISSVVWTIIIFVLCTLPPSEIPQTKIPYLDKIAHFGIFFILSILLSLLLNYRTRKSYFQIIIFATFIAFFYGGIIEILQSRYFNRSGDLYDLIADITGGFLGALIYPIILRIKRKTFLKKVHENTLNTMV